MKNIFDINNLSVVLPPLPPFPKSAVIGIEKNESFPDAEFIEGSATDLVETTIFSTPMAMPLKMKLKSDKLDSDWWLLPVEPMITVGQKNIIAKRNVAKSKLRGSIKERWAQDDYSITITGLFTIPDSLSYPKNDMERLQKFCTAPEPIAVLSPIFEALGIKYLVIESADLPFTKGENNQNWVLNCVSDDDWELFRKTITDAF